MMMSKTSMIESLDNAAKEAEALVKIMEAAIDPKDSKKLIEVSNRLVKLASKLSITGYFYKNYTKDTDKEAEYTLTDSNFNITVL